MSAPYIEYDDYKGWWDESIHYCPDGHETVYQTLSGGEEWWCEICEVRNYYPKEGRPESPAKMLAEGRIEEFRALMNAELEKRKKVRVGDIKNVDAV